MADTTAEACLKALLAAVSSAAPAGVTVLRNEVVPSRVDGTGTLIVRDGDPVLLEVSLSPLTWHYEHRAEIDVLVAGGTAAERDAAFDALRQAVSAAILADRSLGGRCDWVEAEAPAPQEVPHDGASPMKVAVIPVVLHYATTDPLT